MYRVFFEKVLWLRSAISSALLPNYGMIRVSKTSHRRWELCVWSLFLGRGGNVENISGFLVTDDQRFICGILVNLCISQYNSRLLCNCNFFLGDSIWFIITIFFSPYQLFPFFTPPPNFLCSTVPFILILL